MKKIVINARWKAAFTVAALLVQSLNLFAQIEQKPTLIPYRKGNLWGYADQNRQIVITPIFDEADFFNGSWAIVKKNRQSAVINRKGEFLIPFTDKHLYAAENGLIGYFYGQKRFLDTLGNEVEMPLQGPDPEFEHYISKRNREDHYGLITKSNYFKGIAIAGIPDVEGRFRSTLIDRNGKDLLPPKYEFERYLTVNGKTAYLIRTNTRYVKDENKQLVYDEKQKHKFGLLDEKLDYVIPLKFRGIGVKGNFLFVADWFGKAGLWDFEKRKKLTRRRFDQLEPSRRPARAIVNVLGKQGLIDSSGQYIIPLGRHTIELVTRYNSEQFRSLGLQYPDLFYIKKDGSIKVVDPFGKPLKGFHLGELSVLTDSLYLLIKETEKEIATDNSDRIPAYGLLDLEGNVLVPPSYEKYEVQKQNYLVVFSNDTLLSYFTGSGKRLADRTKLRQRNAVFQRPASPETVSQAELTVSNLRSCYYVHQPLPNGNLIVANTCLYSVKSLGIVNEAGKVIVPFHYHQIYPISPALLAVRQAFKWGVLKTDGAVVVPVIYDNIEALPGGNFMTGKKSNSSNWSYNLRDSTEALLTSEVFKRTPVFEGNTAWVPVEGGQIELTRAGKIIGRKTNIPGSDNRQVKPGIYRVQDPDNWSFIDMSGKTVIPKQYGQVKPFSEGLAAVEKNGKWGFIDKGNKVVIPFRYEMAFPFSEGKAFVQTAEGYRVISKSGKFLFPENYQDAQPFSEGMAAVKSNDRWGFINEKGKLVIACKFREVTAFKNGMATYYLSGNYGYLNKAGKLVVLPKYRNLQPFENGYGWMQKGKWFKVNRLGQVVDSAITLPAKPVATISRTKFINHILFRRNQDGTETPLGEFAEALPETEGLIGVNSYSRWYYVDEKGNRFFEEE